MQLFDLGMLSRLINEIVESIAIAAFNENGLKGNMNKAVLLNNAPNARIKSEIIFI